MRKRRKTRQIAAGSLKIGGDAPVSIQSMTSVPIEDVKGSIQQIRELKAGGAELVRVALRNVEAVESLKEVLNAVDLPLCADIHFNYRIALAAIDAGIHKIRINPGNIGNNARVKEVVRAAKGRDIPLRIGVNGGSLDKKKYDCVTPENLVASAMEHVKILQDNDFHDIVVSMKSSEIDHTINANIIFSEQYDYPLHIGLTEAGYGPACMVQSSVSLGHLLLLGIGDTMRVSMTGNPVHEVPVARSILEAVGDRVPVIRMVSCPTCGRTDPSLDILGIAQKVEAHIESNYRELLAKKGRNIIVAVMGCEVNGPGEASHADLGVAGGRKGSMLLFSHGEIIKKINSDDVIEEIDHELKKLVD